MKKWFILLPRNALCLILQPYDDFSYFQLYRKSKHLVHWNNFIVDRVAYIVEYA